MRSGQCPSTQARQVDRARKTQRTLYSIDMCLEVKLYLFIISIMSSSGTGKLLDAPILTHLRNHVGRQTDEPTKPIKPTRHMDTVSRLGAELYFEEWLRSELSSTINPSRQMNTLRESSQVRTLVRTLVRALVCTHGRAKKATNLRKQLSIN